MLDVRRGQLWMTLTDWMVMPLEHVVISFIHADHDAWNCLMICRRTPTGFFDVDPGSMKVMTLFPTQAWTLLSDV